MKAKMKVGKNRKAEFIDDMVALRNHHDAIDAEFRKMDKIFGDTCEGTLWDVMWRVFDAYEEVIKNKWGNRFDIEYWIWEYDFCRRGEGEVTFDGKTFKLTKNPKSLWKLIEAKGKP